MKDQDLDQDLEGNVIISTEKSKEVRLCQGDKKGQKVL